MIFRPTLTLNMQYYIIIITTEKNLEVHSEINGTNKDEPQEIENSDKLLKTVVEEKRSNTENEKGQIKAIIV